jgi:hypothetical protein
MSDYVIGAVTGMYLCLVIAVGFTVVTVVYALQACVWAAEARRALATVRAHVERAEQAADLASTRAAAAREFALLAADPVPLTLAAEANGDVLAVSLASTKGGGS